MFPDYEDFFGLYPRWTEDLKKVTGSGSMRSAQDRNSWLSLGQTFIQHWTVIDWYDIQMCCPEPTLFLKIVMLGDFNFEYTKLH